MSNAIYGFSNVAYTQCVLNKAYAACAIAIFNIVSESIDDREGDGRVREGERQSVQRVLCNSCIYLYTYICMCLCLCTIDLKLLRRHIINCLWKWAWQGAVGRGRADLQDNECVNLSQLIPLNRFGCACCSRKCCWRWEECRVEGSIAESRVEAAVKSLSTCCCNWCANGGH